MIVPFLLGLFMLPAGAAVAASDTLQGVRDRGAVICGVSTGLPGFAAQDADGGWWGFDVAFCRAVAAAALGDAQAVRFVPLDGRERFEALESGVIDLLARNTSWTFSRDAAMPFDFAGVNYFDGQGFLSRRDDAVGGLPALDGATICMVAGTTTERNVADHFRSAGLGYAPRAFADSQQSADAYLAGECQAITADVSQLAALRSAFADPAGHVILPQVISQEPLGPVVRADDPGWTDLVRWTLNAMIAAEALGVTSRDVERLTANPPDNAETRRLLGLEGEFGAAMGLPNDWAAQAIAQVGNYGEVFDATIGLQTPIGLSRGLNAPYTRGGILYAPPFR
jgi:general L-amino acid transport system substrate-binding protein